MISIAIDIFKVKDITVEILYIILSEMGYFDPKLFDTYL